MLFRSKKVLLLPSVWPGTEYRYLGTHLEEEPNNLFRKLSRYSLFIHIQARQEFEHFANGITLIVRDSLEDK